MSSERKDTLKKRLDENYTAFIESLQEKTVSELIAMAPEITAVQQLHTELLDACDDEDMEFLLRFDDPLEVVRGYWESEITGYDHSGEMGHMLWEIRDRELYEKEQLAQTPEDVGGAVQSENLTERKNPMSDVKQINAEDLRHMEGEEGLVLQGCGGDPPGVGGRHQPGTHRGRHSAGRQQIRECRILPARWGDLPAVSLRRCGAEYREVRHVAHPDP